MHSSRMRTTCSSSRPGGRSPLGTLPGADSPGAGTLREQTPPPPGAGTPGTKTPTHCEQND